MEENIKLQIQSYTSRPVSFVFVLNYAMSDFHFLINIFITITVSETIADVPAMNRGATVKISFHFDLKGSFGQKCYILLIIIDLKPIKRIKHLRRWIFFTLFLM